MEAYMFIDFGSTYTKVTAVDVSNRKLLGTAKSFTTIEEDITIGFKNAQAILEEETGIRKWVKKLACSSAAGGLKMVAIGLVEELTAKAAKEAALSAGAKILKVYTMELNEDDISEIEGLTPDIILLTGGTDGGNQKVIIQNCKMLTKMSLKTPIIYAGNRSCKKAALDILKKAFNQVIETENVMPVFSKLNIVPARQAIQKVFLDNIVEAKGIKKAESIIDNVLMPTPLAVMKTAKLLADGTDSMKGLGPLLVVDMGGATTDIHSVCDGHPDKGNIVMKGIDEPYVKRSVEGDLGARYSLKSAIDVTGRKAYIEALAINEKEFDDMINLLLERPDISSHYKDIKKSRLIMSFEHELAKKVVKESVNRHAGTLKEHYTPFGITYEQSGKNLKSVRSVIATGGPLIHSEKTSEILEQVLYEEHEPNRLKPLICQLYMDQEYILAAMGLLSEIEPDAALAITREHLAHLNQNHLNREVR